MNTKIAVVVAALLLAAIVDAQRGGGRGGRGGRPRGGRQGGNGQGGSKPKPTPPDVDVYSWERTLPDGSLAEEKGLVPDGETRMIFFSRDKDQLMAQNLSVSIALYDFNDTMSVVAVRPSKAAPCFLIDTTLTFADVQTELDARNTSASGVTTTVSLSLNGTVQPMSKDEALDKMVTFPGLRRHCRGAKMVETTAVDPSASADDEDTKEVTFLTFDAEVTLVVPARGPRGNGPKGPRGQGNGPKSQGNGLRGGQGNGPRGGQGNGLRGGQGNGAQGQGNGPRGGQGNGPRGGQGNGPRGGQGNAGQGRGRGGRGRGRG